MAFSNIYEIKFEKKIFNYFKFKNRFYFLKILKQDHIFLNYKTNFSDFLIFITSLKNLRKIFSISKIQYLI
jgi:hypothetical protein